MTELIIGFLLERICVNNIVNYIPGIRKEGEPHMLSVNGILIEIQLLQIGACVKHGVCVTECGDCTT